MYPARWIMVAWGHPGLLVMNYAFIWSGLMSELTSTCLRRVWHTEAPFDECLHFPQPDGLSPLFWRLPSISPEIVSCSGAVCSLLSSSLSVKRIMRIGGQAHWHRLLLLRQSEEGVTLGGHPDRPMAVSSVECCSRCLRESGTQKGKDTPRGVVALLAALAEICRVTAERTSSIGWSEPMGGHFSHCAGILRSTEPLCSTSVSQSVFGEGKRREQFRSLEKKTCRFDLNHHLIVKI